MHGPRRCQYSEVGAAGYREARFQEKLIGRVMKDNFQEKWFLIREEGPVCLEKQQGPLACHGVSHRHVYAAHAESLAQGQGTTGIFGQDKS